MLSDRLGRKKTTILIVIVLCVFNAAAAFAPSFRVFCLLRFLSGLGIGGVVPLTITLVSEFSPSGIRARLLTIVGGSFTIGWALAGLFAMFLVPYFGWRSVLLIAISKPCLMSVQVGSLLRLAIGASHSHGAIIPPPCPALIPP
jgi:MFS family permease